MRSHQDNEPGAGQPDYPVQRADGRPDRPATRWQALRGASPALKFVLMVGVMSFFADFTYEGSRSVIGPYLGTLGAGALAISVISGLGEFLGYGLRLFSGRGADRTGRYWPITISGYVVQMAAVPLLALAGSWQVAALLIIAERVGKATRNPPRDAMLSHAAKQMGYGWGFGVHEALDQFGAMFGPLLVALILTLSQHDYKLAFAALAVPAVITLSLVLVARRFFPRPQDLSAGPAEVATSGLPRVFWIYLAGAALVAAGLADFPLIAFHFQQAHTVSAPIVPVFYAVAMAVSGTGSLIFGRLYDKAGIGVLIPLTLCRGGIRAAGVPRRDMGCCGGRCAVGAGHGRAGVDHPGRGGADGLGRSSRLGLRPVHRRLRHRLGAGQRRDRRPVRRVAGRGHRIRSGGAASGTTADPSGPPPDHGRRPRPSGLRHRRPYAPGGLLAARPESGETWMG